MSSTPVISSASHQRRFARLPNKLLFLEQIDRHTIIHDGSGPLIDSLDEPDRFSRMRIPFYIVVFGILSGILYLADFGTDIFVGIVQLVYGHRLEGILILVLACVPSIFVNMVGYLWAIDDLKKSANIFSSYRYKRPVWIVGLITQTMPALFSFQLSSNCCRFRTVLAIRGAIGAQMVEFYYGMLEADRESTLLCMLFSFMKSGPQLLIQAYILCKCLLSGGGYSLNSLYAWAHYASITCSLFGLSWALMSQQRCLRFVRQDKEAMGVTHCILILSWRTFTLAGRLISLLWFALHFHYWLALLLSVHYIIVLTVIGFYEKPKLAQSTTRQCLLLFAVAWVHLFCPWNVAEGPSRWRYAWRYGLECAEFGVVIGLVFSKVDYGREYPVFLAAFCGYVVGLTVMCVYYGCCHPNLSLQRQYPPGNVVRIPSNSVVESGDSVSTGASSKLHAGSGGRCRCCRSEKCNQCVEACCSACEKCGHGVNPMFCGDCCIACCFCCFWCCSSCQC